MTDLDRSTYLPKIVNYADGHYASSNYGAHTLAIVFPSLTLYYSYQTIVAYKDALEGLVVSQNIWGTTTGKHINIITGGDKRDRLPYADFQTRLANVLNRYGMDQ